MSSAAISPARGEARVSRSWRDPSSSTAFGWTCSHTFGPLLLELWPMLCKSKRWKIEGSGDQRKCGVTCFTSRRRTNTLQLWSVRFIHRVHWSANCSTRSLCVVLLLSLDPLASTVAFPLQPCLPYWRPTPQAHTTIVTTVAITASRPASVDVDRGKTSVSSTTSLWWRAD